jgi:hypothetical protein
MSDADQRHAARVAKRLAAKPRNLVAAAYLHDSGKPRGYGLIWRSLMVLWPGARPAPWPHSPLPWYRARQIYHWHEHYAVEALVAAGGDPEVGALISGEGPKDLVSQLKWADDLG